MVNYTTAGQSIQQNLTLNPLGHLSGVVYLDDNVNGQRDSGEAAATGYVVSLLYDGGLPGQTAVPDLLRGDVMFDNSQFTDYVLLKSNGLPTYHLAHVVDDHFMEITHITPVSYTHLTLPTHHSQ